MTNATSEDLLKLKSEIKDEIDETRHTLRKEIQPIVLDTEGLKQDQALIKQSQQTMQENIKEIKQDLKEGFLGIEKTLEEQSKKYVDKVEFKAVTTKIEKYDKRITGIVSAVGFVLLGAILKLIIF